MQKETDTVKWKLEQINYFKKYLNNFKEDSKEFSLLKQGIEKLESSISC
jgi:hypothetical protein